jgi:hypothetical protein
MQIQFKLHITYLAKVKNVSTENKDDISSIVSEINIQNNILNNQIYQVKLLLIRSNENYGLTTKIFLLYQPFLHFFSFNCDKVYIPLFQRYTTLSANSSDP